MVTRREVLAGAVAAGALMHTRFGFAKAVQSVTKVNFTVPVGACDCHTHIHGDPKEFPWFAGRVYTPEMAVPGEMAAIHKALGVQRVVIVTPSVYGTDNSASLWGMQARGKTARGVAVIDSKTTESELDTMGQLGMRGIRLNLATGGTSDPSVGRQRLQAALERMKRRNWHVQLNTSLAMISAMKDLIAASPVPVVFDHFGGARPELGVQQPGFGDMVDLVRSGKAYVKISVSAGPRPDYSGFMPLAKALIAANVDRILWGTNWPHPNSAGGSTTRVSPLFQVDNGLVLNQLPLWAPDVAIRKKILADNPAKLYAFV
jgi:predicted TIM-barrel fold metal-dependent hydrolase